MLNQLTQHEIELVEAFCKNERMFEAVRKVLLAGLYTHGTIGAKATNGVAVPTPNPLVNGAYGLVQHSSGYPMTDEVLGQHLRGMWYGVNALKNAIDELKTIKSEGVPSPLKDEFKDAQ